jgi:hypothetical protein
MLALLYLDLNPAAQGSSLTEGKRGKRLKKANGESNGTNGTEDGGRSSDNDSNDQVVEAPNKLADENVSILVTFASRDLNIGLSVDGTESVPQVHKMDSFFKKIQLKLFIVMLKLHELLDMDNAFTKLKSKVFAMLQVRRSQIRFPTRSLNIFNLPNPSSCTRPWGFTQPLTEMSTKKIFMTLLLAIRITQIL